MGGVTPRNHPAAAIARRVTELGAEIDARLPPGPLTVVGVLRGAFMFMADLVRVIPRELQCDFLGVRSYGDATISSGVVEIPATWRRRSRPAGPAGGGHRRHGADAEVPGRPAEGARPGQRAHLRAAGQTELPRITAGALLDFVGFDAPDAFVVGYGMDAAQLYRNLPYVGALDE